MMYKKGKDTIRGDFKVVSSGISSQTGKWEYELKDAKTGEQFDDGKRVEEAVLERTS